MSKITNFSQYIWLVETIRKAGHISLAQINEQWKMTDWSAGEEIPRATFNRHRAAIEEKFGIIIGCDRRNGNVYFIANEQEMHTNSIAHWLLTTLTINSAVADALSIKERVLLQSAPLEGEFLVTIIQAMKLQQKLCITYLRYGKDEPKQHTIEPYAIKHFKQRWYLLAHYLLEPSPESPDPERYTIFALDRIKQMHITDESFIIQRNFNANAFFEHYFGVLIDRTTPAEDVVIRAYDKSRYYLQDLPLHPSQRVYAEGGNYTDFKLHLCPTPDFYNHILGYGPCLQVLQPQWLADRIHDMVREMAERYETGKECTNEPQKRESEGGGKMLSLLEIVNYCKDCVEWRNAENIVNMLNYLLGEKSTEKDHDLVKSIADEFKSRSARTFVNGPIYGISGNQAINIVTHK